MESEYKYKKVYGDTGESLIKAVIERTLKKYPKKDIHNLLQNGKEIKAHQMIAKAFGKFAAEIDHVAYLPHKEAMPRDQHSLHWRFFEDTYSLGYRYEHIKHFSSAYDIEIKDAKKIWDLLLSGKKDGVTTYENPRLISRFSFLIDAKECPLPRQTLARILGIQPSPLLIKTKPQLAIKDIKAQEEDEIPEIKEEANTNNTTEVNTNNQDLKSAQDKNCTNTNNIAGTTGVIYALGMISTPFVYLAEEKKNTKKYHILSKLLAVCSIILATISFGLYQSTQKKDKEETKKDIESNKEEIVEETNKPDAKKEKKLPNILDGVKSINKTNQTDEVKQRTGIFAPIGDFLWGKRRKKKVVILNYKKRYKLDENFMGKDFFICNEELLNELDGDYCDIVQNAFHDLKEVYDGTHPKLKEVLGDDTELYLITARSYLETHFELMTEFPEIIDNRKKYDMDWFNRRDLEGMQVMHGRRWDDGDEIHELRFVEEDYNDYFIFPNVSSKIEDPDLEVVQFNNRSFAV